MHALSLHNADSNWNGNNFCKVMSCIHKFIKTIINFVTIKLLSIKWFQEFGLPTQTVHMLCTGDKEL